MKALPAMLRIALSIAAAVFASTAWAQEPADDPFRYLEDGSEPRTRAFFREQGERARAALDAIPGSARMLERVRALSAEATTVTQLAATPARVFYLKLSPGRSSAVLCMREGVGGAERVLVDPSVHDEGSRRASIDWHVPSPDGRHVAYGISGGGSEDSILRVVAVDGARVLPFQIDRARFNTGLAWHPDSRSFYYARIPATNAPAKRYANVRVYRHVLGRESSRDEVVFGPGVGGARDVPEFVFPSLHLPIESRYAYAIAREGVRREIAVHVALQRDLAAGQPRWRKLAGPEDEVLALEGWQDDLYLLSRRDAPRRRLLRVRADAESLASARVVAAHPDVSIESFGIARDAIYLRTMVAGVDRLERVQLGLLGPRAPEYLRTPFDTAISQLVTHPRVAGAMLRMQGWIEPPVVVQVEAGSGSLRRTSIQPRAPVDYSDMDEVRLYAPGRDGTKIPVTLVYRKTTRLDGNNPTLLLAYGSYGITLSPTFDPARLAWLERGGVFAVAHVRGGGEHGEEWHQAGRGALKANTILDLIAAAEFLSRYGFTNPRRLALQGTGAGAIPVAGLLVRRPDLIAAAVMRVPVTDMVRFELTPNGPANVPEFGSSASAEGLAALRMISAYHHVRDGLEYPAVLLTASLNDPRVAPWQPAKMAARLQAANAGDRPILLRMEEDGGHQGATREQRERELADIYAFLLWQLGP
ncbi:MAG TPA: prolyl oligopeptidase family serine peptidase [Usitatibacter sp.]|nr:prolyl oligopeptidase family serine peptidase [Usitatibacter sp.]